MVVKVMLLRYWNFVNEIREEIAICSLLSNVAFFGYQLVKLGITDEIMLLKVTHEIDNY